MRGTSKKYRLTKLELKQFDLIQALLREIDKPTNVQWRKPNPTETRTTHER